MSETDKAAVAAMGVECLRACDQSHGGDGNPATVYGHHASVRVCIRLNGSDVWVYDPRWEGKAVGPASSLARVRLESAADGWNAGYATGHRQACPGRCTHGVARNPYADDLRALTPTDGPS